MIYYIEDFNDSRLDVYARVSEKQLMHYLEPDLGYFIAESPKVILRALDHGYAPVSALVEDKQIEGEAKEVIEKLGDIDIFTSDFQTLTKLTGFHLTRGMLCLMKRKPYASLQDIIKDKRRICIMEGVVNPTNVGAMYRNAAALYNDAIILTKDCSDPLYRRSERTSMGTVFQLPYTVIDEINLEVVDSLHQEGYKLVALALEKDSYRIDDPLICQQEKLAIVLGNEGHGLKKETLALCDYTVYIPMSHEVDSLNVAACGALVFYALNSLKFTQ